MADYVWRITKDYINVDLPEQDRCEGIIGPYGATADQIRAISDDTISTSKFRMYDDDGELYYEGIIMPNPLESTNDLSGFEPLDDFGMPDSGATSIAYRDTFTGRWETL